jgi:hypothetical protein
MIRVLRPGGIIYLDHEANDSYWADDPTYNGFRRLVTLNTPATNNDWKKCLRPANYLIAFKHIVNPRYASQGDIHVWPEDHIHWDEVKGVLANLECRIMLEQDYLLYRRGYDLAVYDQYRGMVNDVKLLVARKGA